MGWAVWICCADLKAMTPTHKVPMALLTSLDNAVKDVPEGIMVIRVGTHFG